MSRWVPKDADERMAERIRQTWMEIEKHLGAHAPDPDPSTEIAVQVNRDGMVQFISPTECYALTRSGSALRYRPSRDGREDVDYFRNGKRVDHIVNHVPPLA